MTEIQMKMAEKLGLDEMSFMRKNADEPSQLDRIEAQALYTALMTDTLLEEVSDV